MKPVKFRDVPVGWQFYHIGLKWRKTCNTYAETQNIRMSFHDAEIVNW